MRQGMHPVDTREGPQVQSLLEMTKIRVDLALVEAGLVESRSQAQKLVMAGQVRVNGELVHQSSQRVEAGAKITLDQGPAFVSRGGEKLEAALQAFEIQPAGSICADIGASTGGFTDCLLQQGASRVYAIDVGRGQLHWKLRQDARVVPLEGQNIRYLEALPERVDLVVVDVSFISVGLVLPVIADLIRPGGNIVILVKPQFEAGREHVRRGGVVKDEHIRMDTVARVIDSARAEGLWAHGLIRSPLKGPKGNEEFLLWLCEATAERDPQELLDSVFETTGNAGRGFSP